MINQPSPSNGYSHHAIVETLIDLDASRFDITVGSWVEENTGSKPLLTTVLSVKYPLWLPEYHAQAEQTVNEHPEWTGLPPYKPNSHCYFNWQTKQWEDPRTLQDLKDAQWAKIKQSRSAAEYAGFTWDGSKFDSDVLSQQRINGAVTLAMLSPTFTTDWTLFDNTVRTLSATDMMQVGGALGVHVATQFEKGVVLRDQINSATTREEVEAIVW